MRLLTVDPNTSGMGSVCTLRTESLDRMCSYQALSYTWGEEAPSNMIRVNRQPTLVRQNLELALQHMQTVHRSTSFWVDAVCVNQEDEQEKINQVRMMGKVYERAVEAFNWLGPAKDGSDNAVVLFETMGKKAIEAGIQDFRASTDSQDNEDPLAAIDSMPPYVVDIEKRAKYGGNDVSLRGMISSSLVKDISDCLHQIRPTYIGEAIENIADYEVVPSDSDRDNDVESLGDSCGGLQCQAYEVVRSKSDRLIWASSSYTEVAVLLLGWTHDDQGDQNEVSDLKTVLENYNFRVEEYAVWPISSRSSTQLLQKNLHESVDLPRSEADLVIVYYGGHNKADDPRYGRRIWRISGLSGVEKNGIEKGGENGRRDWRVSGLSGVEKNDTRKRGGNGHIHISLWDGLPTLEGADIEKRGKHVFSSYRSGNPVSKDAPLGERLDTWTRIKAHWSQLRTWVVPSTTFGTRNTREKSPEWTLGDGRSRPRRDTDTSLKSFSRIDRVCLGLNPIIYPPLIWILLRSLHLEPSSLLDRKMQRLIPFASNAIVALEDYPRTALILVVNLSSLTVAVILKPAASMNGRTNLYVCPCWILVLTCGLLFWPLMGGSLLEFCLLFVPFALSVGMTLGLLIEHLWQLRLGKQPRGSRRHHLVLANHSAEKM